MPTYANNLWIVMNFGHRPDLTRTAPYSSYVSKQFCFPDSWAGIPTSKRNNTIGGHPLVNSQEDKSALTWFWCVAVKSIVCKSIIHIILLFCRLNHGETSHFCRATVLRKPSQVSSRCDPVPNCWRLLWSSREVITSPSEMVPRHGMGQACSNLEGTTDWNVYF